MFSVSVDHKAFDVLLVKLQMNIKNLPDTMHNAMQGQEGRLANDALRKLTIIPGAPVYPLRWKSPKQRRAYFATNGFGRGIPSVRKYTLVKGWRVVYTRTATGGQISMTNPVEYMQYVQGDDAQPFHLDTGWVQRGDVQNDFVRETSQQVTAVWWTVSQAVVETRNS